jgi:hypothetical protein
VQRVKLWCSLNLDLRIVQSSLQGSSVGKLGVGVLCENLVEQFFAIGVNAPGGVLGVYFFREWKSQVFFKVPGKLLLVLVRERITNIDRVDRPVRY